MRRALVGSFAAAVLVVPAFMLAVAQTQGASSENLFILALEQGRASAPLPGEPRFAPMVNALQQQSGDTGPIYVRAVRVARFEGQPRCGRIAFMLDQPSSRKAWPQIGGELNLCADGLPPLQVCSKQPGVLVPAGSRCADGNAAEDTPEVAAAISTALARGGLSAVQVRTDLARAQQAASNPGGRP